MSSVPAAGRLEEPWPLMQRLRAVADSRPVLVDVCVALGFDALSSVPLVGYENRWWVWVIDQALVLPLVARRRAPLAVFLVISAVAFVQWLGSVPLAADGALPLAVYTVAAHESRGRALLAAAILEAGVVLASIRFAPADESLLYSLIFLSGLAVAGLFVGITQRTRRAYLESVEERARRLELDKEQEAELAATRERTRIAREMHDIVAHSLSVMIALADGAALAQRRDPDQAREAMANVSATGRTSLREMRRLLDVLRDESRPADLAPQPGLADLAALIATLQLVGPEIALESTGTPVALPQTEDATAYRIVQESLTNVVKHAHHANSVRVRLDWEPDRLRLTITDDGRQLAVAASAGGGTGHGIAGMAERATLFDGALRAGPLPGGGWQVSAELPIVGP